MFSTLSNLSTIIWAIFDMLSANPFNLDQAKLLLFGKELMALKKKSFENLSIFFFHNTFYTFENKF